jgi:hypothetical protein
VALTQNPSLMIVGRQSNAPTRSPVRGYLRFLPEIPD